MSRHQNILTAAGATPVLSLERLGASGLAALYGKYEAGNPSYSLKDRTAIAIVSDLERRRHLRPGTALVVASNGNTAVSLAMVCAVKGYALHVFMSKSVTAEKRLIPAAYGARVHQVTGPDFAAVAAAAQEFCKADPQAVFIDQFDNAAAVDAHASTAEEIIADFTDGLDAFVMAVGTGATLAGVTEPLRRRYPQIKIYAVEPAANAVLSGKPPGASRIQQIGLGFVPANFRRAGVDRVLTVGDQEAFAITQRLARDCGLLVGISSGANVHAALTVAKELGEGKKVLTVLCDQGQRYFSLEKEFTNA